MSQIADITVFDGAATPVSHVLKAISVTKQGNKIESYWREANAALPIYAQIQLWQSIETLKSGVYKTVTRVEVPTMESVSGQNTAGYTAAPKVAFVDRHENISYAHPRSTITGRRLARQLLVNVLGNISTSVAPATAGFAPEAIDQLISAT
jgi:hypothetical protein